MSFIDDMRSQGHAVESTCTVLTKHGCKVAARTYRSWRQAHRSVAARTASGAVVIDALLATVATPESLYGRRKMTAHLRRSGLEVAYCTVDRLMRDLGMNGVRRGKKLRITIPGSDFTYCRTWAGFVYVAFVVDVFAQRIVGWHAATDKRTDLVLTPVRIAMWDRDRHGNPVRPRELLHHSDAGSQHTSLRFTEHLALEGIAPSIGSVGDAYDNGLKESIIGLLKTEAIVTDVFHSGHCKTFADVEYATADWVDWWNHRRLHSSLGQIPPAEYEQDYYAALHLEPQPAWKRQRTRNGSTSSAELPVTFSGFACAGSGVGSGLHRMYLTRAATHSGGVREKPSTLN